MPASVPSLMPLPAMPPPAPLSFQMVPPSVSVSSVVVTVLVLASGKPTALVAETVPVFTGLTISPLVCGSIVACHWMVTVLPAGSTPMSIGAPRNSSSVMEPATAPSASSAPGSRRSPV